MDPQRSERPSERRRREQRQDARRAILDATEALLVEEGYDSNVWDVVCDEPWDWDDSCPFDLSAAEQCLEADWACDMGFLLILVDPPPICDAVYACD